MFPKVPCITCLILIEEVRSNGAELGARANQCWSAEPGAIEPVLGFLKGAGRKQELNVFEFCTLCTKS